MRPLRLAILLLVMLSWGLSYPLIRLALAGGFDPLLLPVARHGIAALALGPVVMWLLWRRPKVAPIGWIWAGLLALTVISIPELAQNFALSLNENATITAFLQSVGPVAAVILAVVFLREKTRARQWFGMTLAVFFTILLVIGLGQQIDVRVRWGNILALVTAVSYALSGIFTKKALEHFKPLDLVMLSPILGFLPLVSIIPFRQDVSIGAITPQGWQALIVLIAISGVLPLLVWYVLLREEPISQTFPLALLIPGFTFIFSYFLLGERLLFIQLLIMIPVGIGVILAQSGPKMEDQTSEGEESDSLKNRAKPADSGPSASGSRP